MVLVEISKYPCIFFVCVGLHKATFVVRTRFVLTISLVIIYPGSACIVGIVCIADTVKEQGELHGVPLMMLANKQDLPEAISTADISVQFDMHKITKVAFRLQPCSGLTW